MFPFCAEPPHKSLLNRLLNDPNGNRSVAYLLGYIQPNPRVRQTGSHSSVSGKKGPVYRDTIEEEGENSNSDSSSEYEPNSRMAGGGDDQVATKIRESVREHQANLDANRARARKAPGGSGAKGKVVVESSGTATPCVTSDDVLLVPGPKSTCARSKVHRTPAFFDVDRCARWKPPSDIGEGDKVELEKLPRLPKP